MSLAWFRKHGYSVRCNPKSNQDMIWKTRRCDICVYKKDQEVFSIKDVSYEQGLQEAFKALNHAK